MREDDVRERLIANLMAERYGPTGEEDPAQFEEML